MDNDIGLVLLGAAAVLGVPILAVAAFIMASGQRSKIRQMLQRLDRLEQEVLKLRDGRSRQPAAEVEPIRTPPAPEQAVARPAIVVAPDPVLPETPAPPVPEPAQVKATPEFVAAASEMPPVRETPRAPPKPAPVRGSSLEERLGARWAVWVGGVALALGGAFLVRYSIDQGLIGPGARIIAGLIFSAVVIAAGEFLRRRDPIGEHVKRRSVYIPGVVTAAGTASLFAIIFAAHAVYGFIDTGTAFVVLGLVGVATMFLAALHGPWLAALGLIGAYVTPLLVSSREPQPWALVIFLLVVTASAFILSRLRLWRWLAMLSLLLALTWGVLLVAIYEHNPMPAAIYVMVLAGLAGLVLVVEPQRRRENVSRFDAVGLLALTGTGGLALLFNAVQAFAPIGLVTALLVTGLGLVLAVTFDAVAAAACLAALMLTVLCLGWPIDLELAGAPVTIVPGSLVFDPLLPMFIERFLAIAGIGGLLLFGATTLALLRRPRSTAPAVALALAGSAGPVLLLAIAYFRVTGFGFSVPWACIALAAAAAHVVATETLGRAELARTPAAHGPGSALQAGAATASLAIALTTMIAGSSLTLAFALAATGVAWVALFRDLPALRWCAAALTLLVVIRFGGVEVLAGEGLKDFPDWRDIALRFALPAAAIGLGGFLLRRRAVDTPAAILDSGAIVLGTAAAAFAIRLYSAGEADALSASVSLSEAGLYTALIFGMALGFARSALKTSSVIHHFAAPVAAVGAVIAALFGPIFASNPAVQGATLGPSLFANELLAGYALPALLAALVAITWQGIDEQGNAVLKRVAGSQTRTLALATGACALVLAFFYVTFETRVIVNGPDMSYDVITVAENYAYSAVWLVFGIVLLAAGLALKSKPLRLASAVMMLLTVGKVFLFDMSGLEGVWRALSFMGLGVVLIGIGLVYQRLLFGGARAAGAAEP